MVIPGGGYAHQAYRLSGFDIAKWFNAIGITAFVLKYRLPQSEDADTCYKVPLEDAQRAIRYIRCNSNIFKIDKNRIGVYGTSAGGHLAACLSTMVENWGKGQDSLDIFPTKPNFAILVSPVISMKENIHKSSVNNLLGKFKSEKTASLFSCEERITADTPPTFIIHAMNDRTVSCLNSLAYFKALKDYNINGCALNIFPQGGHGINITNNTGLTDTWHSSVKKWLKEINIL